MSDHQPDLDFTPPEDAVRAFVPPMNSQAHARKTDPATSHEAAASVRGISETQKAILRLFENHGWMSDERLIFMYQASNFCPPASESGIRSRRAELVRMGKLRNTHSIKKTKSGRDSVVWEIVK